MECGIQRHCLHTGGNDQSQ